MVWLSDANPRWTTFGSSYWEVRILQSSGFAALGYCTSPAIRIANYPYPDEHAIYTSLTFLLVKLSPIAFSYSKRLRPPTHCHVRAPLIILNVQMDLGFVLLIISLYCCFRSPGKGNCTTGERREHPIYFLIQWVILSHRRLCLKSHGGTHVRYRPTQGQVWNLMLRFDSE